MGRANRKASGTSAIRGSDNPIQATGQANDYLSFDSYASYGIPSEAIETYIADDLFSENDLRLALDTVRRAEKLALDPATRDSIHKEPLSPEGLRLAEGVFQELGDIVAGEKTISENLDPDREFLSQDDSDHMYALVAYMRAIREGQVVRGHGTGVGESRLDYYGGLVDMARSISKEAISENL